MGREGEGRGRRGRRGEGMRREGRGEEIEIGSEEGGERRESRERRGRGRKLVANLTLGDNKWISLNSLNLGIFVYVMTTVLISSDRRLMSSREHSRKKYMNDKDTQLGPWISKATLHRERETTPPQQCWAISMLV